MRGDTRDPVKCFGVFDQKREIGFALVDGFKQIESFYF